MYLGKLKPNELDIDVVKKYLRYCPDTGNIEIIKKYSINSVVGKLLGNVYNDNSNKGIARPQLRFCGHLYKLHRLAWFLYYGKFPEKDIDHIDQNPFNNAINNLREVDCSTNSKNRPKVKHNTSGHTGIWIRRYPKSTSYCAEIKSGNIQYKKNFKTLEEAIKQRKEWEKDLGFSELHGT